MVGIKGSGMSALAEIFHKCGAAVEGSDVDDLFYTDALLDDLKIAIHSPDDMRSIRAPYDYVVYSAAYNPAEHQQLRYFSSRSVPLFSYPEMLGAISRETTCVAISGVHGKTTISGISATLVERLRLPGSCIVGGRINSLQGRSTVANGTQFFLAEACEYRRHFLNFHPSLLVITNIELDHPDYYKDYADIRSAFRELGQQIRASGALIYCADNKGARHAAETIALSRSDVTLVPYGKSAIGDFKITKSVLTDAGVHFAIKKWHGQYFELPLLGTHMILNAVAAIAVADVLHQHCHACAPDPRRIATALTTYTGAQRRMEIIGTARETTIIDDYAHHPTAIKATLVSLRQAYKKRRIIVDFMSHTYSRSSALLGEFATSFAHADVVITHDIYASAREEGVKKVSGEQFARALHKHHTHVHYFPQPLQALPFCMELLKPRDIFITLGAGNNWELGRAIYAALQQKKG